MKIKVSVKISRVAPSEGMRLVAALLPSGTGTMASGGQAAFVDAWFDAATLTEALQVVRRLDRELEPPHDKIALIRVKSVLDGTWRMVLINQPELRIPDPTRCRHAQVQLLPGAGTLSECLRCGTRVTL